MSGKHKPIHCNCCDEPWLEVCQSCDKEWPCEAYRKTKDYRIEQLETQVTNAKLAAEAAKREAKRAYEKTRDFDQRMKAMEVYNQRLFDLAKRINALEGRSTALDAGTSCDCNKTRLTFND